MYSTCKKKGGDNKGIVKELILWKFPWKVDKRLCKMIITVKKHIHWMNKRFLSEKKIKIIKIIMKAKQWSKYGILTQCQHSSHQSAFVISEIFHLLLIFQPKKWKPFENNFDKITNEAAYTYTYICTFISFIFCRYTYIYSFIVYIVMKIIYIPKMTALRFHFHLIFLCIPGWW